MSNIPIGGISFWNGIITGSVTRRTKAKNVRLPKTNHDDKIRKKINKIENDIGLWQNNLEFFSRSKNAEKVKEEFNEKINSAYEQLKQLKDQLKLLKTAWSPFFFVTKLTN